MIRCLKQAAFAALALFSLIGAAHADCLSAGDVGNNATLRALNDICTHSQYGYSGTGSLVSGLTTAMTGTTSTAVTGMGAPAAGLRNYITQLTCGNSHATVGTFVDLQDGNGGTSFYTVPAAAVYGGAAISFNAPLKQPTTATALYAKDQTTGANVICSASGFTAP